jgi:hypothetical protein
MKTVKAGKPDLRILGSDLVVVSFDQSVESANASFMVKLVLSIKFLVIELLGVRKDSMSR